MTRPLTDGTGAEEIPEEIRTVERLREFREHVTTHMGGPEAVGAIHAAGRRTAREHIAEFTDPGSFGEIGAFATFVDKVTAPDPGPYGGGIIGGHATLDGRPVTVATDDDSVTAPSARSTGKAARLYQMALQQRHPYIEIAQGHTVPDLAARPGKTGTEGARTFGAEPAFPYLLERQRAILSLAWPGAEIGFMDPPVAANVLYEPQIRQLPEAERAAFLAARAAELGVVFEPYGVAANLTVDDIVEPGATRGVVARYLRTSLASRPPRSTPGPLASWPRWY